MKNEFIPLYSNGQQIGSLFFDLTGGQSIARIGSEGTEMLAAVVVKDMDFVFELVPKSIAGYPADQRPDYLEAALSKDEKIRHKAAKLASDICGEREGEISAAGVMALTKRIDQFLRNGS